MGPDKRRSESQIAVCVHPPERRRRPGTVAACGCCCCCCCLHSLGGLIAASVAGKSRTLEERRATATYWLCLLAALAITTVGSILATGDPMSALLIVVLLLPAYQIATSVVAAIIGGLSVGAPAVSRIWSITWRAFLGAVIGLGIMLVIVFGASEEPGALFLTILGLAVVLGFWYWIRRKRAAMSPVRQ